MDSKWKDRDIERKPKQHSKCLRTCDGVSPGSHSRTAENVQGGVITNVRS